MLPLRSDVSEALGDNAVWLLHRRGLWGYSLPPPSRTRGETCRSPELERLPVGVTFNPNGPYTVARGTAAGVYQALSTRNGGEVVSAGSY